MGEVIPFNRVSFTDVELEFLRSAIDGGHPSGNGFFGQAAEKILTHIHGDGRTLLTTSCTHSLELAARLLDLKPNNEVIVPSFTFVSTASAFLLHGGTPVFVDVDPRTLNLDIALVERAITARTRAICVVHYGGVPASPREFRNLADEYGLVLIEDNAHGLFGSFERQPLGTFGHMSTLSFHETKNITCGEGGALHLNDLSFLERAEILREKGTDRSRFLRGQTDKYTWVDVGSSWVLSDLLAAVLVGQLNRREELQIARMRVWNHYHDSLQLWAEKSGVRVPYLPEGCTHSAHLYHLRLRDLETRARFIRHLGDRGVSAVFHYQPLHLSKVGISLRGNSVRNPVSEDAGDTLVRLPLFPGLTESQLNRITDAVVSFR